MLAKTTIESSEAKRRIPGESIFSLGLVGFSVLALYLSFGIPGEASISMPGTLPLVASMVLLLSAIAFSRRVWAAPAPLKDQSFFRIMTPMRWVNFVLLGIGYVVLLAYFGFLIATFLYLFLTISYLHRGGWMLAFFVSVNFLAIIYMVFRLLFQIILPEGVQGN